MAMSGALLNATMDALMALDDVATATESAVNHISGTTAMTFLGISTKAWTTVLAVYLSVVFVFVIAMTLCCLCCGWFDDSLNPHPPASTQQARAPTSIVVIPSNPAPTYNPPPLPPRKMPSSDMVIEEKKTVTRLPDGSVCTERTTIKSHSSERRHRSSKKASKSALTNAKERSSRLRRASRSSRARRTRPASVRSGRSNRHVSFADERPVSAVESNTRTSTEGEISP
uniref:Membrane-associated protein n=1 Tax=Panagrellus redivivus TaxID=6233 RepID=A0A7E4V2K2_PANRE